MKNLQEKINDKSFLSSVQFRTEIWSELCADEVLCPRCGSAMELTGIVINGSIHSGCRCDCGGGLGWIEDSDGKGRFLLRYSILGYDLVWAAEKAGVLL